MINKNLKTVLNGVGGIHSKVKLCSQHTNTYVFGTQVSEVNKEGPHQINKYR